MEPESATRSTGTRERRSAERLFHRDLPGGGYVAIELVESPHADRTVRVVVERRGDRERRPGHVPPVILEEGWEPERGFGELYRIACDNVAIARGLLRLPRAD
ncbi:MAG TPA: hypothetical protein VFT29_12955 [Gemmatimonadaceae bacterium]|nr:hypothetical protein [Gemmatimonadaceae bacterium]